jgi:hypothetical protein
MSIKSVPGARSLGGERHDKKPCAAGLSASAASCPISNSQHLGVFAQWDGTATLLNGDDVTRWTKRSALFGGHTQGPPSSKV